MATESTAVSGEKQGSLLQDGSRKFVHPADVTGRFTRLRWVVFGALIAIYAALPWITVGGHPAVFLDIQRRRFYLFGETFNAQDFVAGLLPGVTAMGFALIAMTAALFGPRLVRLCLPADGVPRRASTGASSAGSKDRASSASAATRRR
jgi:hypothetical protein